MNQHTDAGQDAENTIRAVKRRRQAKSAEVESGKTAAKPEPDASKRPRGRAASRRREGSGGREAADNSRAIPGEVWERFIGIGSKYYFPDGAPAFTDRGTKLTTPSENTEVVRSLISIAQARGWSSIAVTGSERFRREAWFAGQRLGIDVRGYRASDVEQAQLVRSLATRGVPARRNGQPSPANDEPASGRRQKSRRVRHEEAVDSARARRADVFVGRLLEHGRDTYRHDPLEQSSYYVRLQTKDGEREIWGVDLERAVRHSLSNAQVGDQVTVRAVRREAVTVPARHRDAQGRVIGQKSLATHRNEWIVERTEFLADREQAARIFRNAKTSPQEAVKKHPELQGSYLKLQAVKLGAERDLKDARERARLVARARTLIAESIERGEPLEPVRLREGAARKPDQERTIQRDPGKSR